MRAGEFTAFLAPAVRDAGQRGELAIIPTFGVRFFVQQRVGFGTRIFHMLTAEYQNADNDNDSNRENP